MPGPAQLSMGRAARRAAHRREHARAPLQGVGGHRDDVGLDFGRDGGGGGGRVLRTDLRHGALQGTACRPDLCALRWEQRAACTVSTVRWCCCAHRGARTAGWRAPTCTSSASPGCRSCWRRRTSRRAGWASCACRASACPWPITCPAHEHPQRHGVRARCTGSARGCTTSSRPKSWATAWSGSASPTAWRWKCSGTERRPRARAPRRRRLPGPCRPCRRTPGVKWQKWHVRHSPPWCEGRWWQLAAPRRGSA